MRAINLLPRAAVGEARGGLGGKLPFVASGAVPVIALVLVIVGYSSSQSAVSTKQAQLATLSAQVATLKPAIAVVKPAAPSTAGLVSERSLRLTALQSVLGKEVAWDTTLLDIARVLPANVWLTSLTATSPTPADAVAPAPVPPDPNAPATTTTTATPTPAPAATTTFTIQGSTYTEADVAALLQRLQLLPTLTNVTLVSTSQSLVGKKSLVDFNVTASIQPTPVVTP